MNVDPAEYHALQEVAAIVRENYIGWHKVASAGPDMPWRPLDAAIEHLDSL
jgi:hypothetical protein